ncbi:MAG TPA: YraN family protein [Sedimenticola thiotaurini]|uniref:UPF0102 protein ENI96_15420 n=1 Tax=Sedimenticola thiotaurini TaxID=1543721 RepID=A0A831WBZ5_9GAMM|nr:YraN family protein [Sedimenticola thiotaurini]
MTGGRVRGTAAEQQACRYLRERGLRLVASNFHCRRGEIDLIMQEGGDLVFVEVRYRRSERFGGALESVTPAKQRRIITAANHFLQTHPRWCDHPCRFDVVAIGGAGGDAIDWIKDAFASE